MLRIGLTGGIGSGKTTVARIFEVLGVPVYYADTTAKRLMNENASLRQQVIQHFGEAVYDNNELNRPLLASLVFNDPARLKILNSFVHPATIADAAAWMEVHAAGGNIAYVVKEAALIFESGSEKHLDQVIGVEAPYELRLARAMKRDGLTPAEVKERMDRQMDESEKMNRCDHVIINNEAQLLIPQVLALHNKFLTEANR